MTNDNWELRKVDGCPGSLPWVSCQQLKEGDAGWNQVNSWVEGRGWESGKTRAKRENPRDMQKTYPQGVNRISSMQACEENTQFQGKTHMKRLERAIAYVHAGLEIAHKAPQSPCTFLSDKGTRTIVCSNSPSVVGGNCDHLTCLCGWCRRQVLGEQ